MSYSSASRRLIIDAVSCAVAAFLCAMALAHYDELKLLASQVLGSSLPDQQASAASPFSAAPEDGAAPPGSGTVEIRASRNNHFHAQAEINGRPVPVLIDTGATLVSLSYEDASRAGIHLRQSDFTRSTYTANGVARVAPVMLDSVQIGDITVRDVQAAVSEPGRLSTTLLGMSFLTRLRRFDMRAGVLVLQE